MIRDGRPCDACKRPTPTQAQWDYEGPLHGDGYGCQCDECAAMCWGDPIDCARATKDASPRRRLIIDAAGDLVSKFLYYDRKEDEDLPVGAIEQAFAMSEIDVEELVTMFRVELYKAAAQGKM